MANQNLVHPEDSFIGPNDESYILGLASDITDAKEAKRLIEEQNEQLKEQARKL